MADPRQEARELAAELSGLAQLRESQDAIAERLLAYRKRVRQEAFNEARLLALAYAPNGGDASARHIREHGAAWISEAIRAKAGKEV